MSSGAFGGRFDPASPNAPQGFAPGEIPLGVDVPADGGFSADSDSAADAASPADTVLAAGARIRRDRIALGGGETDCGGISGLVVHPAHRGDGLFGQLLRGVLARCAEEGMALSMLYPSNPEIYRGHGYQVVARVESLLVPLLDLQRLKPVPGRRTLAVTEAAMPRVRALYEELTAGDNGMLRRIGPFFPPGLPGKGWCAVLLVDEAGRDRGYVSWTRRVGQEEPGLDVHELLGRNREDRLALLRVLGSWSTVTEHIRLRVRSEDPVLDVLPSGRTRPAPGPVPLVMTRVVDTAALLAARPAPAGLDGAFRLVVDDDTASAGTCPAAGTFDVAISDGKVRATPSAADPSALPTVRLDVHAAALLLTGGRSLADAHRLGLRAEPDPAAGALLDALVAGPRPSVLDAF